MCVLFSREPAKELIGRSYVFVISKFYLYGKRTDKIIFLWFCDIGVGWYCFFGIFFFQWERMHCTMGLVLMNPYSFEDSHQ